MQPRVCATDLVDAGSTCVVQVHRRCTVLAIRHDNEAAPVLRPRKDVRVLARKRFIQQSLVLPQLIVEPDPRDVGDRRTNDAIGIRIYTRSADIELIVKQERLAELTGYGRKRIQTEVVRSLRARSDDEVAIRVQAVDRNLRDLDCLLHDHFPAAVASLEDRVLVTLLCIFDTEYGFTRFIDNPIAREPGPSVHQSLSIVLRVD